MESFIGSFVCFGGALEDRFVIDSGATSHMVKDINLLDDYETLSKPLQVHVSVKQLTDDGYKIIFFKERVLC